MGPLSTHSSIDDTIYDNDDVTGSRNLEEDLLTIRMESIAHDSDQGSEASDEFYDAKDDFSETLSLTKWSSMELVAEEPAAAGGYIPQKEVYRIGPPELSAKYDRQISTRSADSYLSNPASASPVPSSCPTVCLLLVFHGGSVLEATAELSSKKSDVTTFRGAFESVMRQHYPCMIGRIAIRLVPCPAMCSEALSIFSSLSPYSFDVSPSSADGNVAVTRDAIPIGAVPLFMTNSPDYADALSKVVMRANVVYHEFLKSEEGVGFAGQVSIIGDSAGAIFAYDALCGFQGSGHDRHDTASGNHGSLSSESLDKAGLHASLSGNHHQYHQGSYKVLESLAESETWEPTGDGARRKQSCQKSWSDVPGADSASAGDSSKSEHAPLKAFLSAPAPRSYSISSCDSQTTQLDFEVTDFFMMGSPLSIILAFRKIQNVDERNGAPPRPTCFQMFNLFHPANPVASRLEPLLCPRFSQLPPLPIPRYSKYPMGDGNPTNLLEYLQSSPFLLSWGSGSPLATADSTVHPTPVASLRHRRISDSLGPPSSGTTSAPDFASITAITTISQKWWGNKRIDYALYCPEGLTSFPTIALPHLFHASYWESHDVIAFILRQVVRYDPSADSGDEREARVFSPSQPREKWNKKRTSVKIKNCSANHRGNDVIVGEGMDQILTAKFAYGPLDVVGLTGEKIDIHAMPDTSTGEWVPLGTETTDKSGRIKFRIPAEQAFGHGVYPIKMVVRGDHTFVDLHLAVVPKETECVVFSIDGSFTASVSVTAKDPKVRPGAVDVVRHWQEHGYLIIYITGRPDMQQRRVISWLAQHNFPHGLVSFADGVSKEFLTHKAEYLGHLVKDVGLVIHAGYGSSKDVGVYQSLGLKPEQINIVGKISKKQAACCNNICDGYAVHLNELMAPGGCRPAQGNARILIPRGFFAFPGQGIRPLRRSQSVKRTPSFPGTSAPSTPLPSQVHASPKTRRTWLAATNFMPKAKFSSVAHHVVDVMRWRGFGPGQHEPFDGTTTF